MTRFRLGLRVGDVAAAADFYAGLGFDVVGTVPDPSGRPVMTILERDGVLLIADALQGMPFPDTDRERQITSGPRGLGVAIGLGVDDLEAAFVYCQASGCTITCDPVDEAWGERVFELIDPVGYQWELSETVTDVDTAEGLAAVRASWFGDAP